MNFAVSHCKPHTEKLYQCILLMNSITLRCCTTPHIMARRFRYKKKWAINKKPTGPCQLALGNFDAFYRPVYGKKWPLIRLSLLSLPKYCAVVNNFADPDQVKHKLANFGAQDFVLKADRLSRDLQNTWKQPDPASIDPSLNHENVEAIHSQNSHLISQEPSNHGKETVEDEDSINVLNPEDEAMYDEFYRDNVNVFVPTVKVLSAKDELMREEISMSTFQPRDIEVSVRKPAVTAIPSDVSAFIFPPGDMSRYPPAKAYNRRLGYYLMDAASVLPVLALNVQPTDIVLDLCAAPGGKTVLILQTLDLAAGGHLHCNDSSNGRVQRLKNVLESYFPSHVSDEVEITQMDGRVQNEPIYNKVLVDVPCNADRHVVNDEDNNLFAPIRTKERLGLMHLQTQLLVSAIKSCVLGGEVVYSTCTLAPAQNDGVIQAAVEQLTETSQIEVVIQDMSDFVRLFQDHLLFFDKTKYGQTVIPDMLNNSGPTYFAKLKRVK